MARLLGFAFNNTQKLILGRIMGSRVPIPRYFSVSASARATHMYVVGKSGKGKSKFLQHCILSDVLAGRGCGVIDPHGDLVQETIANLYYRGFFDDPQAAAKFIYINPADQDVVTPFNVLVTPDNPSRETIYATARFVINTLKRAWKDNLQAAPNFEDIMENALILLIKTRQTLVDLPRLFTADTTYRDGLLARADDSLLNEFFHDRFDQMNRGSAAERKESSVNKVNPLRNNPHISLMLGQPDNWIDFDRFINEGRAVFVDLGRCNPDTEELLGNFFTHGFERAAFARDAIPQSQRRPFYLYIDEFHDFSETSSKAFSRILSGARKYGLSLTLANQYLGQFKTNEMREAVFGNVATKVFFGVSEYDALDLAPAIGLGHVAPDIIKHEAQTETQIPLYQPLTEQERELAATLANQPTARAIVRADDGRKIEIQTMKIPDADPLPDQIFKRVVVSYGVPYHKARQAFRQTNADCEVPPYDTVST